MVLCLDPPPQVVAELFPWVEKEAAALEERVEQNKYAEDYALRHFLRVLTWF